MSQEPLPDFNDSAQPDTSGPVEDGPTWKDPDLVEWLKSEYCSLPLSDGTSRTAAIETIFSRALSEPSLVLFRPDAIWTALQNTYYLERATPAVEHFQETGDIEVLLRALTAARQGWVRSSGVALENFLVRLYQSFVEGIDPPIIIIRKKDLGRDPRTRKAANRGEHEIGTAKEDDLYAVTADGEGGWYVFGVLHIKSSVGDRLYQPMARSESLMDLGIWSIYHTLDPMEVARSPAGMLVNPKYINQINLGRQGDPERPGFHGVYVGRNRDGRRPLPGNAEDAPVNRIIDTSMRERDAFTEDLLRARNAWFSGGGTLPWDWY